MRGAHANPYVAADRSDEATPFRLAEQEWDKRIGQARVQSANWRYGFFALALIEVLTLVVLLYVVMQPRNIPWVVEVDRDGPAVVRGEVGTAGARFTPTELQVRYYVRLFVTSIRRVSSDVGVVKLDQAQAYALVTPRAHDVLQPYFRAFGDPLARAQSGVVKVEIAAAIPATASTWQVDWTELRWDPQQTEPKQTRWRGLFRVQLRAASAVTPENPIGVYIDEYHWDQVR